MPATSPAAIARKTARRKEREAENEIVQLQLRLPLALREKLRTRAFKERRTIAATALLAIEAGLRKPHREAQS